MSAVAEPKPNLEVLLDVPVNLAVVLGHAQLPMRDVLQWTIGSVVPVDKPANAPVDLYVNQKLVARGEIVVIENRFALKITELMGKRP